MSTATVTLSGIEMDESEYLCTLSHSKRFEFTNGVVTAKRGSYMTQKSRVTAANVLSLALLRAASQHGGYAGQAPTANLSDAENRLYRIPDLAYWAPGRPVGESIFRPPTLAVEIVLPDQSVADMREKCRLYRAHGVDVCWLIHPEQRWAEVFDADNDGTRLPPEAALEGPEVPAVHVPRARIWAAIDAAPA